MTLLALRLSVQWRQVCTQIRQRQNSRSFLIPPQLPGEMMSISPLKHSCIHGISLQWMLSWLLELAQLSLAELGGARVGHYKHI